MSEIVHFAGHIADSPAPAAVLISRCSVPASERVFRCVAWFALHLERSALGAGVSTGGVYRERRGLGGR
jgi:hypothetical protein